MPEQDYEFDALEFFAGRGNLTRCLKLSGLRTGSFDVKYKSSRKKRSKPYRSNCMDINSVSGFAHIGFIYCRQYKVLVVYWSAFFKFNGTFSLDGGLTFGMALFFLYEVNVYKWIFAELKWMSVHSFDVYEILRFSWEITRLWTWWNMVQQIYEIFDFWNTVYIRVVYSIYCIYIYIGIYIYIWNTYQGVFGPFLHRLRLCIVALLKARYQKFLATFALKCSSWSPVNRGTSQRAPCATIGCQLYSSVRSSNMMACRCLWDDCFQCFHFEWIQEVDLFVYIESKSQNI